MREDASWSKYTLDAIADVIDPHPSHRAPPVHPGGIPFAGIGDISESGEINILAARPVAPEIALEHSQRYIVAEGDVGYCRVATVGKVIRFRRYDFKFALSPTLALVKPRGVDCGYLEHFLRSTFFSAGLAGLITGTTRSSLGIDLLRKVTILAPTARTEQRRIAEVLDTLDEAIRKTEQVIAKLRQMKQGLLHDLLTRGIDDNGELRDPERHPEQFRNEHGIGSVPTAWQVRPFAEMCESSAFGPRFASDRYAPDGPLATLRTTDMSDEGDIDLITMPRASINPLDVEQHLLKQDDLVISRSGTCGIAGVFPGHFLPVVPGAFLIRFRMRSHIAAHLYRRYFNSSLGRPRLERLAVGGVQKNIKGSEVLRLRVPCLRAYEAKEVVARIESAEERTSSEVSILRKLRLLKEGLMEDLLTGRVHVTNLLNEASA